jgi:hypothetical protein
VICQVAWWFVKSCVESCGAVAKSYGGVSCGGDRLTISVICTCPLFVSFACAFLILRSRFPASKKKGVL